MVDLLSYPLLSYGLLALLLAVSPGADVMLVLTAALRGGARAGLLTAAGISLGAFTWTLLVAVGLASMLTASPALFDVVTYAGVAYMFYLGLAEIRAGLSHRSAVSSIKSADFTDDWSYVGKGLIVNLLNPKVGIFYLSFLPQFLPGGELTVKNVMLLGGIHILFGALWLTACSLAVDKAQSLISSERFNKAVMIVAGCMIILFAVLILRSRL